MSARARSLPRKRPAQDRSRVTVDAIVEAAARLLRSEGVVGVTTNRVAELAGVSIGSLYQYFGSKEALAGAVAEREARKLLDALASRFSEASGGAPEGVVRALVGALVAHYRADPELHRVLRTEVPQGRECERLGGDLELAEQALLAWLQLRGVALRSDRPEGAIFVAVAAVEAVVVQALLTRPERFEDPSLESELVDLAVRYLLPDPSAAPDPVP